MKKDPHHRREAEKYDHPIASREMILSTLKSLGEPASIDWLSEKLDCLGERENQALRARLQAMVRDGQLVRDGRQVYAIAGKVELIKGWVSAHPDGFGFLIPDEDESGDVFLSFHQMRQVFHGDRVVVRVRGLDRRGRREGEIVEVLERLTHQLVGRLYPMVDGGRDDSFVLEPSSKRITQEMLVAKDDTLGATPDQIVVTEVLEQPGPHRKARGRVIEILGEHLTPGLEVDIALRNNHIPAEFSDEVIEEADRMPTQVIKQDKDDRCDLTKVPFITIDGEDARDFDDAVYCEKNNQGWRLYVAIADVSHYVTPNSPLDQSAFDRGTSVYFPQYVVPMLPETLSNGLCSLRPEVERLTMVCEMTLSAQGRVSGFKFYQGVIKSHARLTYNQVTAVLAPDELTPEMLEKVRPKKKLSAPVMDNLELLLSLYKVLEERRKERGALDLDTVELGFVFDSIGRLKNIEPRTRQVAHRLIEECMLCANVSAARFLQKHCPAGLYRVHEPPETDRIEKLRDFLATLGIRLGGGIQPDPADMQKAIEQLLNKKSGQIFQMAILRSLQQARYQRDNKGHYGLNYKEYTHFTSPIRRYPDLIVHRLIKSVIQSRKKTDHVARFGKPVKKTGKRYSEEEMDAIGNQSSTVERRADAAVYEVLDWIKCDYLMEHVGDTFEGIVASVTSFGLFVELKTLYVEGLVHISTLKGDYYHFDSSAQCLVGEKTAYRFGLADMVKVQVVRVDPEEGKIDFELVTHEGSKLKKSGEKSKKPLRNKTTNVSKSRAKKSGKKKSVVKKSGRKKSGRR